MARVCIINNCGLNCSRDQASSSLSACLLAKSQTATVALGVADDAGVVLQLPESNVSASHDNGIAAPRIESFAQSSALSGIHRRHRRWWPRCFVKLSLLVIFEKRRMPQRALAIRAAGGVHLEDAQVEAQLDLLNAVNPLPVRFSDRSQSGFDNPIAQGGSEMSKLMPRI